VVIVKTNAVSYNNAVWRPFEFCCIVVRKQIKILKGDYEFAQEMKLVEQVDLKWSNKQNCYVSQKKLVKFKFQVDECENF
jgi:hypothetical protein